MKKLSITLLSLVLFVGISYSQKTTDTLKLSDVYEKPSTYLISKTELKFDSRSKDELIEIFSNYIPTDFKINDIKVGEDKYILESIINSNHKIPKMYVKTIVKFEDGVITLSFYDEGNVETHSGDFYYYPKKESFYQAKTSKQMKIDSYFKNGVISYKMGKNGKIKGSKYNIISGIKNYKLRISSIPKTIQSFFDEYEPPVEKITNNHLKPNSTEFKISLLSIEDR